MQLFSLLIYLATISSPVISSLTGNPNCAQHDCAYPSSICVFAPTTALSYLKETNCIMMNWHEGILITFSVFYYISQI